MERFTFLSDGWLDAMKRAAQHLFDDSRVPDAAPFSYAEIFTHIPAKLQNETPIGYVLSFIDDKVEVAKASSVDDAADCRVLIEYDVALATMRVASGPAMDALVRQAFGDKTMTISGSAGQIPIDMAKLHDALADQTEVPAA